MLTIKKITKKKKIAILLIINVMTDLAFFFKIFKPLIVAFFGFQRMATLFGIMKIAGLIVVRKFQGLEKFAQCRRFHT